MPTENLILNFYNIIVKIESKPEIINLIKKDFSYFVCDNYNKQLNINLKIFLEKPNFDIIPIIKATFYHPDFIAYDYKHIRYIDYKQVALSTYDYKNEEGTIWSEDVNLLHEISYLLIHSRVGELLDKKNIHRVHALGFAYKNKGVLILLPQGGGKTTLALELLTNYEIKLLSDDIPLITKNKILPFPLRIGIEKNQNINIPKDFISNFIRRNFRPKTLIDIEYFKDKISKETTPNLIFIAERENSYNTRIIKISKFKTFIGFLKNCIIGYGLPQVVEYFLTIKFNDIINKFKIIISRTIISIKIINSSKTFKIILGKNIQLNSRFLIDFIKNI